MEKVNQRALLPFIKRVRETYPNKDIWFYSGYVFDTELTGEGRAVCEVTEELLSYIDVLVDGEFIEEQKNLRLRFRGSENQRIIDVRASLSSGKTFLYELP
jgi:anaerobic ribonucleoside-triphosphate reductase activating protein